MLGVAFEQSDAGPAVCDIDPSSPLIGEVYIGDVLVGLDELDCATHDTKQIHERFVMDQGSRELYIRPKATLSPMPSAAVQSVDDKATAPICAISTPSAEEASAADPAEDGITAQEVATGVAKGAAVLVMAPFALVAAPFYLGYRAATAPGTAPPPDESAVQAPVPVSADVKAVEFTVHLAAMSVDEFDTSTRREFCHGIATKLGAPRRRDRHAVDRGLGRRRGSRGSRGRRSRVSRHVRSARSERRARRRRTFRTLLDHGRALLVGGIAAPREVAG